MNEHKADRYHRLRRRGVALAVVARGGVLLVVSGLGDWAGPAGEWRLDSAAAAGVAGVGLVILAELAAFPFVLYAECGLARRFRLSDEGYGRWSQGHVGLIAVKAAGWGVAAAGGFMTVRWWPAGWWGIATGLFFMVAIARAGLVPWLLGPRVFRARPLPRSALRARLAALAGRVDAPVAAVETWRPAHHRDQANAAVVGLGPTRRILVSESLVEDYSDDEIEVIVAHELGHHVHGDVWQSLVFEVVTVGVVLASIDALVLGDDAATAPPAVGLAMLATSALVAGGTRLAMSPIANGIARWQERRADAYALAITGNRAAFISGLRRLGAHHLAEEAPSRLAEWLFYRHPPFMRRLNTGDGEGA